MRSEGRRLPTILGTSAIVVALLLIGGLSKSTATRYLSIHSDDAGMCDVVNSATIDALEKGSVTSTSIMVCCPGFESFAAYAVVHPIFDYGVHLTLTSELSRFRWGPVLGKDRVPSLVGADGMFWFTDREVAEHADIREVEQELRSQIQRALAYQIPVSHLDHHMWVMYMRPDLLELYVRLGIEFRLPIRYGKSLPPEKRMQRTPALIDAYQRGLARLQAAGMPVFDSVESENYRIEPENKREYYLKQIRSLPVGATEFVVHCAYNNLEGQRPPNAAERDADTRVFTSLEIKAECRRLGVELVNYRQLAEDTRN